MDIRIGTVNPANARRLHRLLEERGARLLTLWDLEIGLEPEETGKSLFGLDGEA